MKTSSIPLNNVNIPHLLLDYNLKELLNKQNNHTSVVLPYVSRITTMVHYKDVEGCEGRPQDKLTLIKQTTIPYMMMRQD